MYNSINDQYSFINKENLLLKEKEILRIINYSNYFPLRKLLSNKIPLNYSLGFLLVIKLFTNYFFFYSLFNTQEQLSILFNLFSSLPLNPNDYILFFKEIFHLPKLTTILSSIKKQITLFKKESTIILKDYLIIKDHALSQFKTNNPYYFIENQDLSESLKIFKIKKFLYEEYLQRYSNNEVKVFYEDIRLKNSIGEMYMITSESKIRDKISDIYQST
jgi:hypothetical protein